MNCTNRINYEWCEHRGHTVYHYQSYVNMVLLLARIYEHNELLKKNIKYKCSIKLRVIAMEYSPSEDSIKSADMNEDEEKTDNEEVDRIVEVAKDEGQTKPEKPMSTCFRFKKKDESKKNQITSNSHSVLLDSKENDKHKDDEHEIEKAACEVLEKAFAKTKSKLQRQKT